MKAPSSKLQAPEKRQGANGKHRTPNIHPSRGRYYGGRADRRTSNGCVAKMPLLAELGSLLSIFYKDAAPTALGGADWRVGGDFKWHKA